MKIESITSSSRSYLKFVYMQNVVELMNHTNTKLKNM